MNEQVIGASVRRKEDFRFLTGAGNYTDDINRPGQRYAYILRSPHAHAEIAGIDTSKAGAAPGVNAVFTGADLQVGGLPCGWLVNSKDGSPMVEPPHPVLAMGKVRHVGDPVAVVIAETLEQAKDAAERIEVSYNPLPAVVASDDAIKPGKPQLFDNAPHNICFDWHLGDKAAVDLAFTQAQHVTRLEIINNRLVSNPMEPRAAIGEYDRSTGDYTLYTTSQDPHVIRLLIASAVLPVPEHKFRVVAPDVGGGFGTKGSLYAEQALVTWAAGKLGRPVKWRASAPRVSLQTIRLATTSLTPSWRSTKTASSLPCGSRLWPISGLISRVLRRRFRPTVMVRCSPGHTRPRPSTSRSRGYSPTLCRSMPIAAPGGPKHATSSSVSSTRLRVRSGLIRPSCAAATSFPATPTLIRRRWR